MGDPPDAIRALLVAILVERGALDRHAMVDVDHGGLERVDGGDWLFKGVNLYRINEHGKGVNGAIRTFRLSRINGLVRRP